MIPQDDTIRIGYAYDEYLQNDKYEYGEDEDNDRPRERLNYSGGGRKLSVKKRPKA